MTKFLKDRIKQKQIGDKCMKRKLKKNTNNKLS